LQYAYQNVNKTAELPACLGTGVAQSV
jgi:hypothetical protein